MAVSIVSKGWRSPEGFLAVSVNDGSGRAGYYVPGQNVVIDGSGRVIVPSSQIAGIETPSTVTPLNPLGPGLIAPAVPTVACWDGTVRPQGECPQRPAPALAPACPSLVPGGSYRPTNSAARYVFQGGKLRLIPDPETASHYGWTDWVDADPTCFTANLIGDPIPSVRGEQPAPPQQPAPRQPAPQQPAPQQPAPDRPAGPLPSTDPPGSTDPFAALFENKTLLIAGAAAVALFAAMSSGRRR